MGPCLGGLFENLVVVEALKARFNRGEESNLYFFRDNDGLEADLLMSEHDALTPIEIKASMTFAPAFVKNLARLKKTSAKINIPRSKAPRYGPTCESSPAMSSTRESWKRNPRELA